MFFSVTTSLSMFPIVKLKFAFNHRLALGNEKPCAKSVTTMHRIFRKILKALQRHCKEIKQTVLSVLFLALF